ncbi:MAG: hypothetical protein CVU67_04625 [Deltaproteobacteria bacterium HGW-Deltaproteobacteria-24]|nr:MAG: hypothetical protein CVU67_04625 [Deltaproteobacteria bacterium HGW-Deltaproteobacteria-24]
MHRIKQLIKGNEKFRSLYFPYFEKDLKLIYDYLDLKVIFSGSSAIQLEHSKADLSRRAILYRFQGLSFREFLELKLDKKFPFYNSVDCSSYFVLNDMIILVFGFFN